MERKIFGLGDTIIETASGMKGMLVIYRLDSGGNQHYLFQPRGLNPKTQEPVDDFWIEEGRIKGGEKVIVDLPVEVLGTRARDKASGFEGTAIVLNYHLNGCVHFEIKPQGTLKETGASIKAHDFDIRRLEGEKIPKWTKEELVKSEKQTPSPISGGGSPLKDI